MRGGDGRHLHSTPRSAVGTVVAYILSQNESLPETWGDCGEVSIAMTLSQVVRYDWDRVRG